MRPPQSLDPSVRQPDSGWRGYSWDQPLSSFLQQTHLASLAAHVAVRFKPEQLAMLLCKGRCCIAARKGVK